MSTSQSYCETAVPTDRDQVTETGNVKWTDVVSPLLTIFLGVVEIYPLMHPAEPCTPPTDSFIKQDHALRDRYCRVSSNLSLILDFAVPLLESVLRGPGRPFQVTRLAAEFREIPTRKGGPWSAFGQGHRLGFSLAGRWSKTKTGDTSASKFPVSAWPEWQLVKVFKSAPLPLQGKRRRDWNDMARSAFPLFGR
jgi:hypothetical protein